MALSIVYWVNYTANKIKMMRKSESAVAADRVLRFLYDSEAFHVQSVVQASMRDRSYRVEVSVLSCQMLDEMTHNSRLQ